jgi:hypothetical protein
MLHCKIIAAMRYWIRLGRIVKGTFTMRDRIRPIHSSFETLRIRSAGGRGDVYFNRRGFPTHEQMTALGMMSCGGRCHLHEAGVSR